MSRPLPTYPTSFLAAVRDWKNRWIARHAESPQVIYLTHGQKNALVREMKSLSKFSSDEISPVLGMKVIVGDKSVLPKWVDGEAPHARQYDIWRTHDRDE